MPPIDLDIPRAWWNQALVDILFPKGHDGVARLYLSSTHIGQLRRLLNTYLQNINHEELVHSDEEILTLMYLAAGGVGIVESLRNSVYQFIVRMRNLPNEVSDDFNQARQAGNWGIAEAAVIRKLVGHVPEFMVHLVVAVHSYMHNGENGGEYYPKMAMSFFEICSDQAEQRGDCEDAIRNRLGQYWPAETSPFRAPMLSLPRWRQDWDVTMVGQS